MSRKVILLLALATLAVSGAHGGKRHAGGGAKRRGGGHAAGGSKRHGVFTKPDPHRLSPDVVVSKREHDGNVTTITEALKRSTTADKRRASGYFIIYIRAGFYEEHLKIIADKVVLIGDGMDATVITGNRCKGRGYTTEQTATLTAGGAGFMA